MMSAQQAKAQRRELDKQRRAQYRKQYLDAVAAFDQEAAKARADRKAALLELKDKCDRDYAVAKAEADAAYRAKVRKAAEERRAEKTAARGSCAADRVEIRKDAGTKIARATAGKSETVKEQRTLLRAEKTAKARGTHRGKSGRRAALAESDEAVRTNIDPIHVPLWNRVKSVIKANSRQSRTEAFQQYVHENPHEVLAVATTGADKRNYAGEQRAHDKERAREHAIHTELEKEEGHPRVPGFPVLREGGLFAVFDHGRLFGRYGTREKAHLAAQELAATRTVDSRARKPPKHPDHDEARARDHAIQTEFEKQEGHPRVPGFPVIGDANGQFAVYDHGRLSGRYGTREKAHLAARDLAAQSKPKKKARTRTSPQSRSVPHEGGLWAKPPASKRLPHTGKTRIPF